MNPIELPKGQNEATANEDYWCTSCQAVAIQENPFAIRKPPPARRALQTLGPSTAGTKTKNVNSMSLRERQSIPRATLLTAEAQEAIALTGAQKSTTRTQIYLRSTTRYCGQMLLDSTTSLDWCPQIKRATSSYSTSCIPSNAHAHVWYSTQ